MTESITPKRFKLNSIIKGYYMDENSKSVLIRIYNGISFWVPKRFIDSTYSQNQNLLQEFLIENWILKKIGCNLSKIKNMKMG